MSSKYSYLSNAHPDFIDSQYKSYKEDPESVDYGWQKFFEGFDFANSTSSEGSLETGNLKEIYVLNLIDGYRTRGHLFTKSNPVRDRRKYSPTLDLENFRLEQSDLDKVFNAGVEVGLGPAKLRDIIDLLEKTYCQSIGAEYRYIRETEIHNWLRDRMENTRNTSEFSMDEKRHMLHKLNQAVVFEKFLGQKYVGQKRFSIEGAESMIPALDELIESGSEGGVEEFVIGMAHRGRLNILVNILNKSYSDVFTEFEEVVGEDEDFLGDVKYHHGYSVDIKTEKGKTVHLSLCPNPSHLEAVGPVAIGKARAKIDAKYNKNANALATLLIHGDASIAGQGVVYETIQMSELEAYQTGGTVHMVINNQVGFTTNYTDARTSTYCTDVAKVTNSPVFHVNGDDVEAVVFVCRLAMEFRQKFNRDVFIDLLCYRRHGHNEGDEPRFTQPNLYKIIEKHPNPRDIYFESLRKQGNVDATLAKQMEKEFQNMLQDNLNDVKKDAKAVKYSFMTSNWKELRPDEDVAEEILRPLADKMLALPEEKSFYKKMTRIFAQRGKMLNETDRLDWSMGELLAYASLLNEGNGIRMSGQDVERGTFGHRHAVLRSEGTEEEFIPLNHVTDEQAQLEIYNSHLSEYAVLAFEYGYSWAAPYHLTIWEAQFGDFVNGAQIVIDQFISSGGQKWRRYSGLVMLLPHGYEGQGPEHSSARMERFLELSSGNNWQVVNPTTPAQMFHLLRRQVRRDFRVPLIVLTPKSLLRLQAATSSFSELTSGSFQEVLDDPTAKAKDVTRILFCSGKVYYDLLKERDEGKHKEVALVRIEQIYPLPVKQVAAIKTKYKKAKETIWVQEEPENMGPWPFILRKSKVLGLAGIDVIARPESASTATGYKKKHVEELAEILAKSFAKVGSESKELLTEAQ
ncbi:UNVERIFIED_CONTAM: hypothetical protein GTU68_061118 [Idotea baltica]|nr:hypothetical protein [Idotea baltica]